MGKATAITAALKFFHKLSVEDLSASFDLSELKKLRTLILRERKKPESVVTGKDIGKINKAIKDRPKFEQAREEGMGKLTVDDDIRSGKTGRTSKEKARIRDDYREAAEEQYMAERGWPGPLKFKEIGPKVADPNVPVLKKPRRKTSVRPAKRKSSSEQNMRNESINAFNKAIKEGRLTEKTANDYMYMGKNEQGRDTFKHRDTRKYIKNKGGMIKRPQMMHGGSHKGKKHSYTAGGSVKEMKLFK